MKIPVRGRNKKKEKESKIKCLILFTPVHILLDD